MKERPTGIIRTAPFLQGGNTMPYRRMMQGLNALNEYDDALFYFGLAQKPVQDVLHFYILVAGRIIGRCNIATWLDHMPEDTEPCDPDNMPACKHWAVLTRPFVRPPHKIYMRGFQGFRYTGDLW